MTAPDPGGIDASALLCELARAPAADRPGLIGVRGEPASVLLTLAEHLERLVLTDLGAAMDGSALLLDLADQSGDVLTRLRARRARAQCFSYANRFAEALSVLDEAGRIAAQHDQGRELALVNMTRLHGLARLGRLDEAVAAGIEARDRLLALGDPVTAAKADVNLGVVQRMRDRPREAVEHFDRALPLFAEQPHIVAQIESNRAEALLDLHDFDGAETAFRSALATFERIGAHRAAAIVEGNLADLMGRQGRLASALRHFEQARRRIERDGSPGDAARLQAESAEVQLQLGMLREASEESASAAEFLAGQGMELESARARMTRARTLAALGQGREADGVLLSAVAQFEAAGKSHDAARASLARVELMLLGGDRSDLHEARRALEGLIPRLHNRPADDAFARALSSEIALQIGGPADPVFALDQASAGLALARPLGLKPLIGRLLHLKARALVQIGRANDAGAVFMEAIEEVERIRGSLQADRFRIAFHAGAASMYSDAVSATLQSTSPTRVVDALELVERARSRALLDLLRAEPEPRPAPASAVPSDGKSEPLEAELSRWRNRLSALYTGLHDSGGQGAAKPGSDRLSVWLNEIEEAESRLARIETRLAASAADGGLYADPLHMEELIERVPTDTAVLEYYIAGGRVLAFLLQNSGPPDLYDLCSLDEVLPAIERLRFQISKAIVRGSRSAAARSAVDINRELERLYDLLLKPAQAEIASRSRLVIVPYGPLHAVPFHALRRDGAFLIESTEILYSPSASVFIQLQARRLLDTETDGGVRRPREGGPERLPLLIGVADEMAPAIEDEVRTIERLLGPCHVLLGEEATLQKVRDLAADASLIHIAAHGMFSGDAHRIAGVRLADGWLTSRDLCALDWRRQVRVITLSGCDTGRSVFTPADEPLGLVRAFFAAGATSVIASLWAVHDQIATELLVRAYRSWYVEGGENRSRSPAAALRTAQIALAQQGTHPAFWAPFFVAGTL
jgi:CHAT domain-containing protein